MKPRRRLALALSVAGLLAPACGSTPPPAVAPPAATGTTPPAPTASPATLPLAQTGIEVTWMDSGADPCQDYFAYACGGFVKSTEISNWSTVAENC